MQKQQFLRSYSGQTCEELIALEGTYRTDSLVLAFEQAMDQKAARIGLNNLTEEERIILAIEALEREVNNGGYDQFFVNSSREYEPIIVTALRRIDCPKTAEITQKAIAIVQMSRTRSDVTDDRTSQEDKERVKALGECDTLYFGGQENIGEKLFAFIKMNRAQITPDLNPPSR